VATGQAASLPVVCRVPFPSARNVLGGDALPCLAAMRINVLNRGRSEGMPTLNLGRLAARAASVMSAGRVTLAAHVIKNKPVALEAVTAKAFPPSVCFEQRTTGL